VPTQTYFPTSMGFDRFYGFLGGMTDQYDPNLVAADTALRNDAERFWFPSAESRFREGEALLRAYVAGLHTTPPSSRPINERNAELIRLCQTWGDMLGDTHARLYRPSAGWLTTDDDFYFAQGITHVVAQLMPAVEREYAHEFERRPVLAELAQDVTLALTAAATLKPFVVFDGRPAGVFANHRRNLDAYVTEARQKIYSIREELEK
jgi:hypothetical protein